MRDERGPVAGARVSATRPRPGGTLSELPCPADSEGSGSPRRKGLKLPDCLEAASGLILERVGAREGEAPLYAETVTSADGSFELEGLPEGDFTLWALGEKGAELRPGVKAGAQDVELVLEDGVTLEGTILDQKEHPLPGARVTILRERHTRFFDTRSGPDGRFRVGPLPKGAYGLFAASEGWLPEFVNDLDLEAQEWKVVLKRPKALVGRVLLGGAPAPGVEVSVRAWECQDFTERKLKTDAEGRFALEHLRPCTYHLMAERDGQSSVKRRDLYSWDERAEVVLKLGEAFHLEGTVWDDARHPVAGAVVSAAPEGAHVRTLKSVTDAQGHYRLGPLGEGAYAFAVSSKGYLDHSETHRVARDAGPVDLALKRSVLLAGRVVNDEGRPLPGVELSIETFGRTEEGHGAYPDFHATSDAEGRFTLDAPEAGTWELEVVGDGFVSQRLSVQAPAEAVRVVLRPGATVVGTVTDSRDIPLEGVLVTLWKAASREEEEEAVGYALTDAQGRFTLRGVQAGRLVAEVTRDRDGIELTAVKSLELQGTEHVEVALRFEEGRTLTGVVVDDHDQPVAGAFIQVAIPHEDTPSWRRHEGKCGMVSNSEVSTGPDGRFTLRHLSADRYALAARKDGYTFVPARAVGGAARKGTLLVSKETSEVRVVLERQGHIRGRVIGPDGAPLRFVDVNPRGQEAPGGTFEVPFEKSGIERLEFSAVDLAPAVRFVEVREGVDVDLGDVRLGPGRRVTGRVLDAKTGAPVAGADIRIEEPTRGTGRFVRTSSFTMTKEDGTFVLDHVEERPLRVSAHHSDHRVGRVPLGTSGEPVTVRLDPGARIEATVRDRAGKPLRGHVILKAKDDAEWHLMTLRNGTGVGVGFEPGLYLAMVAPDAPRSQVPFLARQVRIPASGRVVLNFQERTEGATLALRVADADEDISAILVVGIEPPPVSEETLSLWRAAGLRGEKENGVMTFRYLPPGHATVLVLSSGDRFHVEELELSAEGVVERVVHPRWQSLPGR